MKVIKSLEVCYYLYSAAKLFTTDGFRCVPLGATSTTATRSTFVRTSRISSPSYSSTTSSSYSSTELFSETQSKSNNGADNMAQEEKDDEQKIFNLNCDKNGLMTYRTLRSTPLLAQLIKDKELMEDELLVIWEEAPKASAELVDFKSFKQIYKKVNDLFEDVVDDDDATDDEDDDDAELDEKELKVVFEHLSDEKGLLTKYDLLLWEEVAQLIDDNLLGEDEFDSLWERSSNKTGVMDLAGFLSFNSELDTLFMFDEDNVEQVDISSLESMIGSNLFSGEQQKKTTTTIITTDSSGGKYYDLSPEELFTRLADEDFLVGIEDLKRWGELQDVIESGELLPLELLNMFDSIPNAAGAPGRVDKDGFLALYKSIDELFEEVNEDEPDDSPLPAAVSKTESTTTTDNNNDSAAKASAIESKNKVLTLLKEVYDENDPQSLPCGLTIDDIFVLRVADAVAELEKQSYSNQISSRGTELSPEDFAGEWELLYTSSAMMKFNKGLSGLGSSFPNGKFSGLIQKLKASKYLSDVEYVERILTPTTKESTSFDVTITGDWKLKRSVSLLTGDPTVQLTVEPDRVNYGPTSTRADHWKSVRSMNLLDVTYLDNDLRIMRGNTSTETIFVFRRI